MSQPMGDGDTRGPSVVFTLPYALRATQYERLWARIEGENGAILISERQPRGLFVERSYNLCYVIRGRLAPTSLVGYGSESDA